MVAIVRIYVCSLSPLSRYSPIFRSQRQHRCAELAIRFVRLRRSPVSLNYTSLNCRPNVMGLMSAHVSVSWGQTVEIQLSYRAFIIVACSMVVGSDNAKKGRHSRTLVKQEPSVTKAARGRGGKGGRTGKGGNKTGKVGTASASVPNGPTNDVIPKRQACNSCAKSSQED